MAMLEGKIAIVTGGTGGIGSEAVRTLVKNKAKACVIYHSNDAAAKKLAETKGVFIYKADLSSEDETSSAVKKILSEHKKIDIVVHCATKKTENKRVEKTVWKDYQDNIDVQLKGFYSLVKALQPSIAERAKSATAKSAVDVAGKIVGKAADIGIITKFIVVLTEYVVGKTPSGLSDYIAAKYALLGFSKAMAVELSRMNCTVNMISPGMTDTPLIANLPGKLVEITAESNPMKRIGAPADVAGAILFFASNASDYMTGENMLVNGGSVMR